MFFSTPWGEIPRPQSGNILAIWENDDLTCIPKFAIGSYLIQTIASPVGRGSLGVSVAGGWCNEFLNLNGFVQILGLWFPDPTPPQKKKKNDKFRECSFPTSASRSESSGLVVFAKEFPRCVWLVFKKLCKILTPFLFGGARVLFVQLQQN